MNTTATVKHLAASAAAAAVLAASAGAAGLTLTTATTASAAVPGGAQLRTLHADELQTAAGGLLVPAAHPVPRVRAGTPKNKVW